MLHILMVVALIGLFDWAIQVIVPMTDQFKRIVHVLAVLAAVIFVLQGTGLLHGHVEL